MRGLIGRFAVTAAVIGGLTSTAAAGNVWHYYPSDDLLAFLAVVDEAEADQPEAYFAFSLVCSANDGWTMRIGGVDHVGLGETIARGERPSFSVLIDGKADEILGQYYPEVIFGEMWGEWEYAASWPDALLDQMLAAAEIRVAGAGLDMALPSAGKAEMVGAFKAACAAIDAARRG
jgi:hypothetical protein